MITPRSWPPGTAPSIQQAADWLGRCTPAEREQVVGGLQRAAHIGARCEELGHPEQIEYLERECSRLRLQVEAVRAFAARHASTPGGHNGGEWSSQILRIIDEGTAT